MNERQDKPVMERYLEWAASHQAKPVANRAEFIKARSEIETMLANDVSVRGIWAFLTGEGKITYGLSSFTRDVRKLVAKADPAPSPGRAKLPPIAANPPQSATPATPPADQPATPVDPPASETSEPRPRPKRFHHPESPDMKDYL